MPWPTLETGTVSDGKKGLNPSYQTISMMETFSDGSKLADIHNFHYRNRVSTMAHYRAADFKILCLLGQGAAGRVYLVRRSSDDVIIPTGRNETFFALKVTSHYDVVKKDKQTRFFTERNIMMTSNHPFIMTFHASFADERNFYILMEFCSGGEFAWVLGRQPKHCFSEQIVQHYAAEIIAAFEYLHYHGIIYRDLKTENVLLHHDGHIRLTDFDLAKRLTLGATIDQYRPVQLVKGKKITTIFPTGFQDTTESYVGTPVYLPPEVIKGKHSQAADWWTLGIFMYECLYGFTPFQGNGYSKEMITAKIKQGIFTFPDTPNKVSKKCKDLIKRLLDVNPNTRLGSKLGASELKNHPFFKNINFAISNKPPIIPNVDLGYAPGKGADCEVEYLSRNFSIFSDQYEIMTTDFLGTGADIPQECSKFAPNVLAAFQRSNIPTHPKPIIYDAQGEIINIAGKHEKEIGGRACNVASATVSNVSSIGEITKAIKMPSQAQKERPVTRLTKLFSPLSEEGTEDSDENERDEQKEVGANADASQDAQPNAKGSPHRPYLEIPSSQAPNHANQASNLSLEELRKLALSIPTKHAVDECGWN